MLSSKPKITEETNMTRLYFDPARRAIRRASAQVRPTVLAAAVSTALLPTSAALAFDIDTGNPDIRLRWDNTVSYTAGFRAQDQSDTLTADRNQDDGNRNFGTGLISNRIDLLSELDLTYGNFGARLSGAAWYDDVYNRSNDNDSPATANHSSTEHDEFTDRTRDLHGRKAELLDAFVFGRGELFGKRSSFRLGRHSVLYGESLFFGANGIAGTQGSVDIIKLQSNPNAQFKEIIRPTNQVSASIQLADGVTLGGYYQFSWEALRTPAVGSYFGTTDNAFGGGAERLFVGPFGAWLNHRHDLKAKDSGQGGVQLRLSTGDWDFGLYATRFHSKTPTLYQTFSGPVAPFNANRGIGEFYWVYPEGISAFGASFSTSIDFVNVAGEISTRRNTPLVSDGVNVTGTNADNSHHPAYAVGNTAHAQVSILASLPPNFIAQESSLVAEIAWHRLLSVTKNPQALNPLATRDATALRLVYTPTYRLLFPGTDVRFPIGIGYSPDGRSPVISSGFGTYHGGDVSIGMRATYLDRWNFGVNYTHYFGKEDNFLTGTVPPHITQAQSLRDRNFVTLSVSRSF
ncbi:DUF1302 domain-containing protein [Denitromonas iodatirespirans]|uniref:DUF1302 domain-containing protein n=1 Tax=Denitromonas iodatirespirans TaxID=2795389 RepID=A0A944D9I4_DENI1|nr:DUF1302 domain-containing protein [Denitromonas iodatirespirans]MBT0961182.1 DUF1302 domain-containing protein [Denitromonas iodatirespirans]